MPAKKAKPKAKRKAPAAKKQKAKPKATPTTGERAKNGRFTKGNVIRGGRPKGSFDGVASYRKVVGRILNESGGDLYAFLHKVAQRGPTGAWWLYEHIYEPHAKREKIEGVTQPDKIEIVISEGRT